MTWKTGRMEARKDTVVLETVKIVRTPGVLGGKPRIEGRRISVQHVVIHYLGGWPIEEIAVAFNLSFGQIHAALSYYYEHRDEIDKAIRETEEWVEQIMAEQKAIAPDGDFLDQVMTPPAVAIQYGISPRTVRDAIEQGKITALKSAGTWLIRRADAEARWGKRKK